MPAAISARLRELLGARSLWAFFAQCRDRNAGGADRAAIASQLPPERRPRGAKGRLALRTTVNVRIPITRFAVARAGVRL